MQSGHLMTRTLPSGIYTLPLCSRQRCDIDGRHRILLGSSVRLFTSSGQPGVVQIRSEKCPW